MEREVEDLQIPKELNKSTAGRGNSQDICNCQFSELYSLFFSLPGFSDIRMHFENWLEIGLVPTSLWDNYFGCFP